MKIRFQILLLAFTFLIFNQKGFGQFHPYLKGFNIVKESKSTFLTWTVGRGSLCFGINVYRSTDDIDYVLIGKIEGECGSIETDKVYSFTDKSPVVPGDNYYKLEFGINGFSEPSIKVTFIDYGATGLILRPNLITSGNQVTLYFDNPQNHEMKVDIHAIDGRTFRKSEQFQGGDQYTIKMDVNPGSYIMVLTNLSTNEQMTQYFNVIR